MKVQYKKLFLAFAGMAVLSTAQAAQSFSDQISETAEIVFNAPIVPLELSIAPVTGLSAGLIPASTKVADFSLISGNGNTNYNMGVRWNSASNQTVNTSDSTIAVVSGANPTHKAQFKLVMPNSQSITVGADSYLVSTAALQTALGQITTIAADQIIPADTYTVTLDAALYNP
ncbi:hypothetical protein DFO55_11877 [Grimontella sp. AG753]|nr:hypothetical protein DFO55_11877 [Grimontella sp. AG753]